MREVLPIALAIAASPFPIVPAILLLLSSRPRPTSLAFLCGWLLGARVLGPLGVAKDWLTEHNAAVMAVVLVVIGAVLTTKGVQDI